MDGGAAVVRFEIHPSIGIARVGTSAASFLGPEPDQPAPTNYRDDGALLRQAARFRVFECERDEQQALISAREVTGKDGAINWTAHLVNRKAAGNKFVGVLRNATHPDRTALVVDPGPRSLTGSAASARSTAAGSTRLRCSSARFTPMTMAASTCSAATGKPVRIRRPRSLISLTTTTGGRHVRRTGACRCAHSGWH
jgi:hypothetical protein